MKNTAKKIAAVSGLSSHKLSAEELTEAMDWRGEVYAGATRSDWKPSWDRNGVEKLVNDAKDYYEYKTGKNLPYNLAVHGPWVGHPNGYKLYEGDRFDSASAEEMVETAARFSSWLRIIADENYVGLQQVLEKNLSLRGMCSPRTTIWVYNFLNCWNSPRTAENMLWKSYRRAWQILKPFGLAPSWEAVGRVMTSGRVSHRVGKMAFAIAARTVNYYLSNYRGGSREHSGLMGSSVEILMKARGVDLFKQYSDRGERLNYGFWAIDRVEAGEFSCLREAFVDMEDRLADWGNGEIVDLGGVKKHFGHMVEVPLAFTSGDWYSSFFIFSQKTILEGVPKTAWQKFMAAEILNRHYGQIEVDIEKLHPRSDQYETTESNHVGIRLAIRRWLNEKLVRGHGRPLPFKCFKGLKKNPVRIQIQAWAFDRIFETGEFHNYGRFFETGEFRNYEEAIKASTRLEFDFADGVELLLDPETSQIIHRVKCTIGWDREGERQFLCQQLVTGRSFHVGISWQTAIGANEPRKAVKAAIKAWRIQASLEKRNKEIFQTLRPKNASVLVWFQDSIDSGNCSPGTRSWAESHGFNGDMFCPAEKLLKFADDPRVFRVLQVAAEKVAKLKLAV